MNSTLKRALVGAAVVVAGIACSPVALAPPSVVSPSPVVSPSQVVSPSPSPNPLDTSTWTTYVAERYGFSIAHPADWTEEPADHDWTLATDAAWPNEATEHFVGGPDGAQVAVSAWSVVVDPGTSIGSWLRAYCQKNNVDCNGIQDRAVPATMDGHVGSLVPFDDVPHALFLVDRRIYAIACWRPDTDPTVLKYSGSFRLVEAFLSTMHLLPGGSVPSATTPSPS